MQNQIIKDASIATICGIDPGSDTMGICVMQFNVINLQIVKTHAFTVHGSRMGGNDWLTINYGDRFRRIANLKENLLNVFRQTEPLTIAVEAPFMNMLRPQAYGVLMEVMAAIRSAISEYDLWLDPYLIDPSSVKNAVGAPGNAKKEIIRQCIMNLNYLNSTVDLSLLDEHSLDAIAVALTRFKRLIGV